MTIRMATKYDLPRMVELLHQLFAIEADFTPNHDQQTNGLSRLLSNDRSKIFVAEVMGKVVGMCTVQIMISTAEGRPVGLVEDVVIDIDYRNQGIGTALMRALDEWAVQNSLARLQLQADRNNHPALGFYRSHGWNPTNLIGWMKPLQSN